MVSKKKTKKKESKQFPEIVDKILNCVKKIFKKYWTLFAMNAVIFILTVFIESTYIYKLGTITWMLNTLIFIVVPTIIFYKKKKFDIKSLVLSVPILYILFLIFMDFCTLRDLYGITSSSLNQIPSFISALLVVFIFTFIEYLTISITDFLSKKNIK